MAPLPPKDWPDVLPSSPDPTATCGICHDFDFEFGSSAKQLWETSQELSAYMWEWFLYGPQCQFCNVILELFAHTAASLGYDGHRPHDDYRELLLRVRFREKVVTAHISPPYRPARLTDKWANQLWYLFLPNRMESGAVTSKTSCKHHPSPHSPWKLPVYDNEPTSLQRMAQTISRWLSDCSSSHESPRCANHNQGAPTRLVYMTVGAGSYKVVESRGMKVRYTALSYCWGGEPEQETTESNYHQRLQGQSLNNLPRLLTDAIELTALCGLQYIWIDALCIIQDRVSDREHELQRLPETYANATFTISAAHAKDVHHSLVPQRMAPATIVNRFSSENVSAQILAVKAPIHGPLGLHNPVYSTPWPALVRAWTFQERLLSRRVVQFAPDELIWECSSHILCECGEVRDRDSFKWMFDRLENMDFNGHIFKTFWGFLVQGATQRKVSREEDLLVTMGGLAKHFAHHAGGKAGPYVAGMWSFDLIHGISWFVQLDTEADRERPSCWVAPSWSWASVKSETSYFQYNPDLCTDHAEVVTVECKPQSMVNPYGQVTNGLLSLRGPCLNMTVDLSDPTQPLDCEMQNAQATGIQCDLYWDVPLQSDSCEVTQADSLKLMLLWGSWPEKLVAGFLIFVMLRPHQTHIYTWERVGIACIAPPKEEHTEMAKLERWINGLPIEVISIM